MVDFRYTARTSSGEKVAGVIEAESEASVLRSLEEQSLFPIEIVDKTSSSSTVTYGRVGARELGVMYGQLADLLCSGVPLLRSLDSLIRSATSKRLKPLLQDIRGAVANGQSLTDSMRDHPETFPQLHVAMVQAGERASFLEDVLASLAGFIERLDELQGKVRGALIYPALLSLLGVSVMIAALLFFVPKFEPLLEGVEKPLPTTIIFGLSYIVRAHWGGVLFGLAFATVALVSAVRSAKGRQMLEMWRLKIPVVGSALRMVAITRFCRILGTMLANGVPLLQALAISKGSTGSRILAERIEEAVESVRAGATLVAPLSKGDFMPPQILAMIAVAEESNHLQKVLVQIADTVERRTHRRVDQAVRLLEPVILCVVAAAIGFLALGLLLAIFTLASSLGAQ